MLESGQGVTLAIEEGGTREQAVTFLATWQGVLWHSVAAPAEGVQVTLYHHLPSAPLLLHSAHDRQIFILYVLIQILLNANANSDYGIRNDKSHAFDVSFYLMWVDSLTFLSPYRIIFFPVGGDYGAPCTLFLLQTLVILFPNHRWDLESTDRFIFRPKPHFVLFDSATTALAASCTPTFLLPSLLFGLAFMNLPLTWPSTFSKLPRLIRDLPLWELHSTPIPWCVSFLLPWPQKHFPSLTLRSILTWTSFCHQFALCWPFCEKVLLCHDSCLVGYRSGTRCSFLRSPPSSTFSLLPDGSQPLSWAGCFFFNNSLIELLSSSFFPTISLHPDSPLSSFVKWFDLVLVSHSDPGWRQLTAA